jgi:uncharacterized DUF497 family protein
VGFERDSAKAGSNLRKHQVDFADAATALEDPHALTMADDFSEEEERWITLAMDVTGRLLVVVWTWREASIRLISARSATRNECLHYEEQR